MVIFGTPSFGPKLNFFTRSTTSLPSADEARSVDSIRQGATQPLGSMGVRRMILPASAGVRAGCRVGVGGSARL